MVALLDTYNDARETLQAGAKGEGGGGYLQMPNLWHQGSYADLERTLLVMRALGQKGSIMEYGTGQRMSLRIAYWHVDQWWISAERRVARACPWCVENKPAGYRGKFYNLPHTHPNKKGKTVEIEPTKAPIRDIIRHRDANETKAHAGAQWIADRMPGSPQLPLPFLENLTGYVPRSEKKAA